MTATEGLCEYGKVRYVDKIAAMLALASCQRRRSGARKECKAYRCRACGGWHLTSRSDEHGRRDTRAAYA